MLRRSSSVCLSLGPGTYSPDPGPILAVNAPAMHYVGVLPIIQFDTMPIFETTTRAYVTLNMTEQ